MKKLLSFFALLLTVCSTAIAQTPTLTLESEVGTTGILIGRAAMVVDLGGDIGKVAVATMNLHAKDVYDYGTIIELNEDYDPSTLALTNGWYVPTIEELEALKNLLTPNEENTGYEYQVEGAVLTLPGYRNEMSGGRTMYVGKYLSSSKPDTKYHSLAFAITKIEINTGDNSTSDFPSTIRPFHKLPSSIDDYWIHYTTKNDHPDPPYSNAFRSKINTNTIDKNGNGTITFSNDLVSIDYQAFYNLGTLTSITIPFTVSDIGDQAFRGCTSLAYVYFGGDCPIFGADVFEDNVNFIVPDECINAYKKALNTDKVYGNSPEYLSNFKAQALADIVAALGDSNESSYLNNLVAEEVAAIKNATKIGDIITAKNAALSKLEEGKNRYAIFKEVAAIELGGFIIEQNGPVTEVSGADGQAIKLYKMKNVKFSNVNDK